MEWLEMTCEDNLEMMGRYDDGAFNIAITDAPYGIEDNWSKSRKDRFYKNGRAAGYTNDKIPPKEWFDNVFRTAEEQIFWGGNYFTEFLPPTNSWLIWDKKRNYELTHMSEAEMAWSSFNHPARFIRLLWDGYKKCEQVDKWHPHQKPRMLYDWIIEKYVKKGWTILDPNIGSGSLGMAVKRANMLFGKELKLVACDIEERFVDRAYKEIKAYVPQVEMF